MYLGSSLAPVAALSPLLALSPLATSWIGTIVIGFLVGVVSKFIVGGKEPTGCLITIIIGIAGAIIALYIGKALGRYEDGSTPGFLASTAGAIVLLSVYHYFTRNSSGGSGPTV